jgi:hypothetical protein
MMGIISTSLRLMRRLRMSALRFATPLTIIIPESETYCNEETTKHSALKGDHRTYGLPVLLPLATAGKTA